MEPLLGLGLGLNVNALYCSKKMDYIPDLLERSIAFTMFHCIFIRMMTKICEIIINYIYFTIYIYYLFNEIYANLANAFDLVNSFFFILTHIML